MKKINSRSKGCRGEREFANLLKLYGFDARRGQQFSGNPDAPDVVTSLDHTMHFEVKRVEKLNIHDAMAQCMKDCPDGSGKYRVVAHKKNRKDWLVTMHVEDWMDLVKEWLELKEL